MGDVTDLQLARMGLFEAASSAHEPAHSGVEHWTEVMERQGDAPAKLRWLLAQMQVVARHQKVLAVEVPLGLLQELMAHIDDQ